MKSYSTLILVLFAASIAFSQKYVNLKITSSTDLSRGFYLNVQNQNYGFKEGKEFHELKLETENPEFGFFVSPKGKRFTFWYDEGDTELHFEQGLLKNELKVTGSKSHQIYSNLREASDFKDFKAIFEANKASIVSLNYIDRYFKFVKFTEDEFVELYNLIGEENRAQIPEFEAFINSMNKQKLEKDNQFIDFLGYDENGNAVNTVDFRGQYLLVDVAASWCAPCWKAFPYMIEANEKYANIQFITLNEDDNIKLWNSVAKKRGLNINWPVIWDTAENKSELLLQYQIESFPTYILVDPDGVVVERWSLTIEKVFKSKLKKHLN